MKRGKMSKKAMRYLCSGLLLVTIVPMLARHYHWPDFVHGFAIGAGLSLEIWALIISRKEKTACCG